MASEMAFLASAPDLPAIPAEADPRVVEPSMDMLCWCRGRAGVAAGGVC